MTSSKSVNLLPVLILGFAFGLSGCDQLRTKLESAIQPQSPAQSLQDATRNYQTAHFTEAIELAEPFTRQTVPEQAEFALLVSKSYVALGNTEQALRYLALASQATELDMTAVMVDPSFESIRTEPGFVALVAGLRSHTVTRRTAPPSTNETKASITNSGIEASTGGVSVKIAH